MIIAYGDESIIRDDRDDRVVAFAFFLVQSDRVVEVEHAIGEFKAGAGVAATLDLHCKEMFRNLQPEQTSRWAHLQRSDLFYRLEQLCAAVARITPRPVGCGTLLDAVPPVWKDDRSIFGGYHPKNLVTVAYTMAAQRVMSNHPSARLIIDEDRTKIPFGRQRQAHNTREFFVNDDDGRGPVQFVPEIARAPKPQALQLADLYAYALSHALDLQERWRENFQRLLDAGQFDNVPFVPLNAEPEWRTAGDRPDTITDILTTLWVLTKDGRKVNVMWAPTPGAGFWVASKQHDDDVWHHNLACDTYDEAMARAREIRDGYLAEGWELAP
jgi:hypothetical protein